MRRPVWTPAKLFALEKLLDAGLDYQTIAKQLGVTTMAIRSCRQHYGIRAAFRRGYTARAVSRLLGVDVRAVLRWIRDGRLEAARGRVYYGGTRVWRISHEQLVAFLENPAHWHCWNAERISDTALKQWAGELRGAVRYVSFKEAAKRLWISTQGLWWRIQHGWGYVVAYDGSLAYVREDTL